ncbi:unnamed protein product [Clonostachys rosea]|uniref:Glucose-methanol-choline oxidoreductase N-terminal domain-containing protein n=1 Tax=Bionectria ochroleuca TaxID=29856 RepID=A0ABY6UQY4_BIOOC|nr:unnamed protein product [Clonostachys rosea]
MTFDYVIAGGGTAGLVIANRLSEDPSTNVVVIEPGRDVRDDADVLNVDRAGVTYSPDLDWKFKSIAQPQLGNRVIDHPAGKALGGTTVINGLYYIRGNKAEYDAWERLGNPGWNWDTLLPYFIRSEKFAIPAKAQGEAGMSYLPQYHGESGPLNTGHPSHVENGTFYDSARKTCEELGFSLNPDMNGGKTRGFGAYPKTMDRDANVRESAARAYYEPIDGRRNLKVIQGAVKRIIFEDGDGGKVVATGLEYTDDKGHLMSVTAKKEVIISAGTYVSPLILEASGVGNPSILARNGITTKVELPAVGEALQDQTLWVLMFQANPGLVGHVPFAAFATAEDVFKSATDTVEAATREKLASWSEMIAKRLNGGVSAGALKQRFEIQHNVIFGQKSSVVEFEFFSVGNVIGIVFSPTLPFSWGSAHINAAGEISNPEVDPNFLSIDYDKQVALEVGRIARKIWSTKPLSDLAGDLIVPGDAVLPENATDAQWAEFLTSSCVPASHTIGTCAMLPQELGGVVDPTLKVYGTANVRVVDASVIPHLISGHTSAAVYALAEKASDLIKESLATGS